MDFWQSEPSRTRRRVQAHSDSCAEGGGPQEDWAGECASSFLYAGFNISLNLIPFG